MDETKQILVVEDDPAIRQMIAEILTDEGYSAVCVDSGAEALQILNTTRFHLITLDLGLPDMSGNDLLKELSRGGLGNSYAVTPVIIVSANPRQLISTPQVKAVIPKPFNLVDLINSIEQSLAAH